MDKLDIRWRVSTLPVYPNILFKVNNDYTYDKCKYIELNNTFIPECIIEFSDNVLFPPLKIDKDSLILNVLDDIYNYMMFPITYADLVPYQLEYKLLGRSYLYRWELLAPDIILNKFIPKPEKNRYIAKLIK